MTNSLQPNVMERVVNGYIAGDEATIAFWLSETDATSREQLELQRKRLNLEAGDFSIV